LPWAAMQHADRTRSAPKMVTRKGVDAFPLR
jgi:hypothetical protein